MKKNMNFKKLRSNPRPLFFFACITILIIFTLGHVTEQTRKIEHLSYSSFLKAVDEGKIKSVTISGQQAQGEMTDGKTYFETTLPENNPQQWEALKKSNVDLNVREEANSSASWMWFTILSSLLGLIALIWLITRQFRGGSGNSSNSMLFSIGKSRAKMILPSQIKIKFSHVAGARDAKEELANIVNFLKNPQQFKRLGARLPRGILLVGDPGNGKTLLAKAVAGEANCPFFMVTGSDFVEVFVGVGAARIRDLFAQARKSAPCIVFIDEIDAIGRQRGAGLGGGNDEREQTLNQLLTEMDGFENSDTPIVILAATNIPDVLDKALLRPGRFDHRIDVPFPDTQARKDIILIAGHDIKLSPHINIEKLAEDTAGFSGADMANLINIAALSASKNGRDAVEQEDIDQARDKIFKSQETHHKRHGLHGHSNDVTPAKMFMPHQIKTTFADVAGAKEAKEEVADVVNFLKNPEPFKRLGAHVPRGVLLIGEPGNGKTLLAKAIAGEAGRPFFSISGSDFVEVYVGVGASRVRELFAQARKHAPSIVFIDEIDSIGGKRGMRWGGSDEYSQTLNQLLTELDGFSTNEGDVIIIAATNRVDTLDSALLRPGRFDRHIVVPFPDISAREEILRVHIRKIKLDINVDINRIARATTGFSGADLANLVNEAAIIATKSQKDFVGNLDLEAARDKIIMGKEVRSIVMSQDEIKTTAFHEAGHALVNMLMPESTEPLFKVTIVPRSNSLGSTHYIPDRERYLSTKEEMLASIMVSLGGRIAEELKFNSLSTGARGDFQSATRLAWNMVCTYGMSQKLGPVSYYDQMQQNIHISEETARTIDQEVRDIIANCYGKVKTLLDQHRDKLEKLAQLLLEKETVDAQEAYICLGMEPRKAIEPTTDK